MQQIHLHFAHANGFPSGSYRQLFKQLTAANFKLSYIEKLGHNPLYKVDNNWQSTAKEIIANIEANCSAPVVGLGHSYGSISTLIAYTMRPDLFSTIIMCEPPLVMSWGSAMIKFLKAVGMIEQYSPAKKSRHRRQYFADAESMLNYCKSKTLFAAMSDAVIMDYIKAGTYFCEQKQQLRLSYQVAIECAVFNTIPDNLECLKVPQSMQGHLLIGNDSTAIRPHFAKRLCAKYNLKALNMPGGHLFLLENPDQAAAKIKSLIHNL